MINDQNISWSERIQACIAHMFILFLFVVSAVIMHFRPLAEPIFHSKGKFLPVDLFLEWLVNMMIMRGNPLLMIVFINYLVLLIWARIAKSPFVKLHVQKALNFAHISFLVSAWGYFTLFGRMTPARAQDILNYFNNSTISVFGFYVSFFERLFLCVAWYSLAFIAGIRALFGAIYEYPIKIQIKGRTDL